MELKTNLFRHTFIDNIHARSGSGQARDPAESSRLLRPSALPPPVPTAEVYGLPTLLL